MATEKRSRRRSPSAAMPSASLTSSSNPEAAILHSPSPSLDLIPDITSRLISLEDFFDLRASCRAYRAILPPSSEALACQSPLLLVALLPSTEALFHVSLRCLHRFRFPWRPPPAAPSTTTPEDPEQLSTSPKVPAPFTRVIIPDSIMGRVRPQ